MATITDETRVLRSGAIAGWFQCDDPARDYPGILKVEEHSDGFWYDVGGEARGESGGVVRVEAKEIVSVENLTERLNAAVGAMEEAGESVPHYEILVKKVVPFDESTEVSIIIEDELCRVFIPDRGECERVGVPIKRLTH